LESTDGCESQLEASTTSISSDSVLMRMTLPNVLMNVREAPSFDSQVVGNLNYGEIVEFKAETVTDNGTTIINYYHNIQITINITTAEWGSMVTNLTTSRSNHQATFCRLSDPNSPATKYWEKVIKHTILSLLLLFIIFTTRFQVIVVVLISVTFVIVVKAIVLIMCVVVASLVASLRLLRTLSYQSLWLLATINTL